VINICKQSYRTCVFPQRNIEHLFNMIRKELLKSAVNDVVYRKKVVHCNIVQKSIDNYENIYTFCLYTRIKNKQSMSKCSRSAFKRGENALRHSYQLYSLAQRS
jgi:hypothetical protein